MFQFARAKICAGERVPLGQFVEIRPPRGGYGQVVARVSACVLFPAPSCGCDKSHRAPAGWQRQSVRPRPSPAPRGPRPRQRPHAQTPHTRSTPSARAGTRRARRATGLTCRSPTPYQNRVARVRNHDALQHGAGRSNRGWQGLRHTPDNDTAWGRYAASNRAPIPLQSFCKNRLPSLSIEAFMPLSSTNKEQRNDLHHAAVHR